MKLIRAACLGAILCAPLPAPSLAQDTPVSSAPGIESEISVAIDPNDADHLIITAMDLGGGQACRVYHSEDAGDTWQQSAQSFGLADPVLAYGDDGQAQLAYLDFGSTLEVGIATTTNNGVSWTSQALPLDGLAVDRPWIQIDDSPASPSYGSTFLAYFHPEGVSDIHFVRIQPNGTASANQPVHTQSYARTQNPALAVADDGGVTVCFLAQDAVNGFGIETAISTDSGATFSAGTRVAAVNMFNGSGNPVADVVGFAPGAASRLGLSLQMGVDKSGGAFDDRVYVTWSDFPAGAPQSGLDVYLSFSDDRGATWSAPTIVNDDGVAGTSQYYAGIHVNPSGTVCLGWYDRRVDPTNDALTDFYFASSSDGGVTFAPNVRVSSASSDHQAITTGATTFGVGEYTGLAASATHAYPVWADGRDDDGELDVYVAKISLGGATSVHEIRLVQGLELSAPTPHPARGTTTIDYTLPEDGQARLEVFDVAGRKIQTLFEGRQRRGAQTIAFDAGGLAAGVYLVRLEFGSQRATRKLTIVR